MRRVRYHQYGGPDVLTVEEVDVPRPGPGQVLIRASTVGTNFVDVLTRTGPASGPLFQRPLPGSPTGDVVGTVEAVGEGVDAALVGRRVAALVERDAYADLALADARWLAPVPDALDDATATALPTAGPVALGVLRAGQVGPGETVLVHAAAGGIGHLAVQLAGLLGAGRTIATSGSTAKLDFARACGADAAVDLSSDDWPDRVREAAPGGVDVVVDAIGGAVLLRSLDLLAPLGRAVVYGAASGDLADIPVTGLFAMRSVTGFALLAWRAAAPEQARRDIAEVTDHAAAGRLSVAVHARLPLAEAAEAHRVLESRAHSGRVLLVP